MQDAGYDWKCYTGLNLSQKTFLMIYIPAMKNWVRNCTTLENR